MLLKDFMQALLKEAALNPNSLANRMGKRSVQSVVERITEGSTLNPRMATIEPIAAFFRVPPSAFFDSTVADEVAIARGWVLPEGNERDTAANSARSTPVVLLAPASAARLSIQDLATQIAQHLAPYDISARKAAASLLADLALHPEQGAATAAHLSRLLGTQGNEPPLASIRSQSNGN